MKILIVGDVIGSPGRTYIKENLTSIKNKYKLLLLSNKFISNLLFVDSPTSLNFTYGGFPIMLSNLFDIS